MIKVTTMESLKFVSWIWILSAVNVMFILKIYLNR